MKRHVLEQFVEVWTACIRPVISMPHPVGRTALHCKSPLQRRCGVLLFSLLFMLLFLFAPIPGGPTLRLPPLGLDIASAAQIENIRTGMDGNIAYVLYDLVGSLGERDASVGVAIELAGKRYNADQLSLSGDFGKKVSIGRDRRIMWSILQDFPAGISNEGIWDLQASSPVRKAPNKTKKPATGFIEEAAGIEFVLVRGGCFRMGNVFKSGAKDELPAHDVCLDEYYLGKYEVTQLQWQTIMGSNPSHFSSCGPDCPVDSVSWKDVREFISRLNRLSDMAYRLPTEAEWEYAARNGGKKYPYAGALTVDELSDYAWFDGNSGDAPHRVGLKRPGQSGLYDMSGNVWEWVQDWYGEDYYAFSVRQNPSGPASGEKRVLRGGSWSYLPKFARSTFRFHLPPDSRGTSIGFRLATSAR